MGSPRAYYNEIDAKAADWLRWLISENLIPIGDVDTRSIAEVQPEDLHGYTQAHFFAGIGGWGYAARLAGWPDDLELWTGSCPCQPFSVAGKGLGTDDPRHLWPHYHRLVRACRPPVVVGEQVAGKAGYGWLDGVRADLEGEGYACRGVDLPACAVDAPHIRQRLYWVAVVDTPSIGRREGRPEPELRGGRPAPAGADASSVGQADADGTRLEVGPCLAGDAGAQRSASERGHAGDVGDPCGPAGGRDPGGLPPAETRERGAGELLGRQLDGPRSPNGRNGTFWSDAEWIVCHDGKARRTQPGTPLLAHGVPARVAKWRGLGNAIVPQLAAEVLGALLECL